MPVTCPSLESRWTRGIAFVIIILALAAIFGGVLGPTTVVKPATLRPTFATVAPTKTPTTIAPTVNPTKNPTKKPTSAPTKNPTKRPTTAAPA